MRKRMPYNNMNRNNNNMNRGNNRNNQNNRRPMRGGGFDDEEMIHPRQRKHAQNMREKYINQARDAQINGDRVQSEYWLQHAEHYSRILNAINEMYAPAPGTNGEEGADMHGDESGMDGHSHNGADGDDVHSHGASQTHSQTPRPPRPPRRPYQGQQNNAHDGSAPTSGEHNQRGRGAWRQPRDAQAGHHESQPSAETRTPDRQIQESGVSEELGLPLAAVLPAARMDDDHQE